MPTRKRKVKHGEIVRIFAERLRALRLGQSLTQRELADKAVVPLSYVSRLEAGGVAPGIDLLERLATALSVDVTELLPSRAVPDTLGAQRQQVSGLFNSVVGKAGRETLQMVEVFLARLAESSSLAR